MNIPVDRTVLVPVIVASISISTTVEWVIHSEGGVDVTQLILKSAAAIASYVLVLLLLSRRFWGRWKLLLLVALFGTFVNLALSTVIDSSFSYMYGYSRGVYSLREWSGLWMTTLVGREIISPLFMVMFLVIAFPLHGIMLLIRRGRGVSEILCF